MTGSHYDNPLRISYTFAGVDFASVTAVKEVAVPPGKTMARIDSVSGAVSEVFACDQTEAQYVCGITGTDVDKFMQLKIPDATAVDTHFNEAIDAGAFTDSVNGAADPYGGANVINVGAQGEDITSLDFLPIAGVDAGTETGIADMTVVISWW
jgi:hypothetical protein